jgi:hypothetical protein
MATAFQISAAARNAIITAAAALVDAGSGPGTLEIRTGAAPATPATADSGTLLLDEELTDPAFDITGPTADLGDTVTGTVLASGDAGHWRIKDSDGNVIFQGSAGEAADTPDMVFDEKSLVLGGTVAVSVLSITAPAA